MNKMMSKLSIVCWVVIVAGTLLIANAKSQPGPKRQKMVDTTSWNVENVTAANLDDNLDAICSALVNNPSDITFLQEILNSPQDIANRIVDRLQKRYSVNETWSAVWSHVGNEGSRKEYDIAIIRSTPTRKVTIQDYGLLDRANIYSRPEDLVFRSSMGSGKDETRIRENGPTGIGNRVPFIVKATVQNSGLEAVNISLANWHAPGPQSGNGSDLFAMFAPKLQREGVAVVTADFNYESNGRFTIERPGGTTRGGKQYDGAVLLDVSKYRVADTTPAQGYDTRKGLFDHRAIRVRVDGLK